ncbi:MAG: RNA polymerase sigma factor SigJ [Acidimicrobiia bacterium]|nr:MAG: RNA polymerase sigma factor SigJ [Acidimicrobiia bacterium]
MSGPYADAVAVFERERPRLTGLAYRLLGSLTDAEDVVQEAWVRWQRADRSAVERPEAWLTTVVSRLGLDRLKARRRDRAVYVGPWLPEPLVAPAGAPHGSVPPGPEAHAELADSLTTAFLLLLERLTPEERLAVLLADVFREPFARIAGILGRSEPAARQLASRARRRLRDAATAEPVPVRPGDEEQARVVSGLLAALAAGDVDGAARLLAPGVVLVADGGPDRRAARRPVVGPARVARLLVYLASGSPTAWCRGPPGSTATRACSSGTGAGGRCTRSPCRSATRAPSRASTSW